MNQIKNFIVQYRHAWVLSYALIYIIWFDYLEKEINSKVSYHIVHTSLDDDIPFCEYFIVPYLLWFLYMAVSVLYFLFTNKDDYYRLCAFLFSGMTISLIICSFFPNGTNFRPMVDSSKNIFSALVAWLYKTDTCTNVFPSIHCYNSIAAAIAIIKSSDIAKCRFGKFIKSGSILLTVLICLSTLFLKQHSVLDVCGAIIMVTIVYGFVYGYPVFSQAPQPSRYQRRGRY